MVCSLCGMGEAGSEHCLRLFPLIRLAWSKLSTDDWRLHKPMARPMADIKVAIAFNRGVTFLACTLSSAATPPREMVIRLLIRQTAATRLASMPSADGDLDPADDDPNEADGVSAWLWPGDFCGLPRCDCRHNTGLRVRTWLGRHRDVSHAACENAMHASLETTSACNTGQLLLALASTTRLGRWPARDDAVLGQPMMADKAAANTQHSCSRCNKCGTFWLRFTALKPIGSGRLLTVDDLPTDSILSPPQKQGKLISFDGGARKARDGRVRAGAGAILWSALSPEGKRLPLAAAMAICPQIADSTAAEAMGLALALALARYAREPHKLTIIGDNLPLVRFAASNGRLRTDLIWLIAGASLLASAPLLPAVGWEAVRRCFNRGADRIATAAVRAANKGAAPSLRYQGAGLTDRDFALCPCSPAERSGDLLELRTPKVERKRTSKPLRPRPKSRAAL